MARRKLFNFLIDPDLAEGLKEVKERDGIGESEQARRAIRAWLEEKGAIKKAERKRVAPRERS
jgi:hypothetical protein